MAGYLSHPHVRTPNLDRLAAAGTHFTRAYCNSPICTPSRMSFITGKYVHEIGSWMNSIPLGPAEMTWPRRLDQAGIPSTMLGKMDFCGDYQDGGFTHHRIIRRRGAFGTWPMTKPWPARLAGFRRPDKRKHVRMAGPRAQTLLSDGGFVGEADDTIGNYDHDRIVTDWAVQWLQEAGANPSAGPWALYVGLLMPHWPFRVPDKYFDMYYPDRLDLPVDAHFPNDGLHPAVRNFQDGLDLGDVTEDMLRRVIAAYYGMITCLDEMIGEILAELASQGLADNTCVIYTSDHGEMLGEHGLFYKECAYEGSVGVPLVVAGPGLPAGGRIDRPVSLVDLYPTVLDMAGVATEPELPGRSWLPLLGGQPHERPDYAFSEYHGTFFRHDWYMLVRGDYKYTYYVNERPTLHNLAEDPDEMTDLAGDSASAPMLGEFEALLRTVVDPEAVAGRAKRDFGLIAPDGEDYTETLTVADLPRRGLS